MPADFWRAHRALPVSSDPDAIVVVSSAPLPGEAAAEIRSRSYSSVRQAASASDEIEMWLSVALGDLTWERALARSIHLLIREIGLASSPEPELPVFSDRDVDVDVIASAFGLAEDAAVEVLALRARLPQIRLPRYRPPAYLSAVLPEAVARELRAVPVLIHRGLVVVATARVHGPAARARLRSAVGADVRIALCAPSDLEVAQRQLFPVGATPPSAPAEDRVRAQLAASSALSGPRRGALERVAAVAGGTPADAAVRLGYVTSSGLRAATARLLGLEPLAVAKAHVDREAARSARPERWRALRCVPVARTGRVLVIATDRRPSVAELHVIAELAGAGQAVARYALPEEIETLLRDLPEHAAAAYGIDDHLFSSGIVAPEKERPARRAAARARVPLASVLVARGVIGPDDVAEAAAIASGRPWIHVDRCSPDPAATDALDEATARSALAFPLAHRGRSLLVAFADPSADVARIETAAGMAVDPIYAASKDAEHLYARWYEKRTAVAAAYVQFAGALVARGWLDRQQADQALENVRRGLALDVALAGRSMLDEGQVASALAAFLAVSHAELGPRERTVRTFDALGRERRSVVVEDPVDHALARRVPQGTAATLGVVPVVDRGRSVEVAFVDPLDERAHREVEAAIGRPLTVSVATRTEIAAAQRRVYERPSIGESLVQAGVITEAQLEHAVELHAKTAVRIGAALVTLGYMTERELAAAIAEQSGLAFVDLFSAQPDPSVARLVTADIARDRGVLPLLDDGTSLVVATTDLLDAEQIGRVPGLETRKVIPVVVTESSFDRALNEIWRDEYAHISAAQLMSRSPDDSARWVLSSGQKVFFAAVLLATAIGLVYAPVITVTAFVTVSTLFYVTLSAYKFFLAYVAVGTSLEIEVTPEDLALLDDRELPVYTILVPVYREARVLPILTKAIERLDYPRTKLDVKILFEEDDTDTMEVARRARPPSYFDLLVVPRGQPQGKPKACNYGLIHARGEYVVIFDAEDIPEADQLKKAIVAFRKGSAKLACVQAKLNYFNQGQNLLTRWFTTEYSMWFDLFLPGLDASRAPIPLGGTSNHFRTARLRDLGAWDPHNVTEDADLGMRLYKRGWTTAVIDSTTFEEANSELYNWIRQRSRWVKGYIQTYLVHMRHPVRLYREVGARGFLSFQFVVGGTFFGYLVNPLYWLLTAAWFLFHWGIVKEIFPGFVFYLGAVGLYIGNFAFTYLNVAGCLRRQYHDMVKYALLSPIYWAFMSVAAWKGFLQLFYKPSYWEKTEHGLYRGAIRLENSDARPAA